MADPTNSPQAVPRITKQQWASLRQLVEDTDFGGIDDLGLVEDGDDMRLTPLGRAALARYEAEREREIKRATIEDVDAAVEQFCENEDGISADVATALRAYLRREVQP